MLYIRKGKEPHSLTSYKQEKNVYFDGAPKDDIRQCLLTEQGYLCAYCMRRIDANAMKIEHWFPQNLLNTEKEKLDYTNMLGCCLGKNEGSSHRDEICDTHKEGEKITVNPLDERTIRKIAYHQATGEIYSLDENIQHDLDVTLNLNCNAFCLKENRKAKLDEAIRRLAALRQEGRWGKSMMKKVLASYKNPDQYGKKKEFAGIVIWYLEKKINSN